MSDLNAYRQQVTNLGKMAVEAEKAEKWEEAYNNYYQALKIFSHLIKCKFTTPFSYKKYTNVYLQI